ncbi:BRCA2 repeat domain-containing protein [Phthorimaea operculella]|nr:BRCA2 repeat domain-containing protein [Phthorimaea operculella]
MDKNSEIIANFEALLKQQRATRATFLYNNKTNENNAGKTSNHKPNPQSIISNLARQMKAIQSSENFKSVKKPPAYMEKYKTSEFLPVNMLEGQKKPPNPQDPQKFDTQLISNTQLINIVEDAEALDVNVGMTQEFETTFFNEDDDIDNTDGQQTQKPTQQDTVFPILDISLKEPDPKPILSPEKLKLNLNYVNARKSSVSPESQINTDTQFDNCTQILDQCIEIDDIDEVGEILNRSTQEPILLSPLNEINEGKETSIKQGDDIDEPLSPVFNVKNKKTVDNTPCLVYDLERFESFEKIAMPVIEMTQDQDHAKFLINSQIIDKELIIQTPFEDIKPISPIIEICDIPLKVDKELMAKSNNPVLDKNRDPELKETESLDKCFLEDEILFSSDEENEYQNQSYKDLPFTCALETSFYESVDVLDKTMYVGFQTASNKSIQIETESFCKAKSLLDNIEEDLKNEETLTELISLCERNKDNTKVTSPHNIDDNKGMISPVYESDKENIKSTDNVKIAFVDSAKAVNMPMEADKLEPHYENSSSSKNDIIDAHDLVIEHINRSDFKTCQDAGFEGFRTASNKAIHISEKALKKSEYILQNLDRGKSTHLTQEVSKQFETNENISVESKNIEKVEQVLLKTEEQNIGDDIIDEFQEEIMHTDLEEVMKNIENNVYRNSQSSRKSQRQKSVESKNLSRENTQVCDVEFQEYYHIDFTSQTVPKQVVTSSPNMLGKDKNIPPKNITFRTASNKEITVSNEALAKTKNVFNDFDMNDNITHNGRDNLACDKVRLKIPEGDMNLPSITTATSTQVKELNSEKDIKIIMNNTNNAEFCDINLVNNLDTAMEEEPPFCGFEHNDEFFGRIEETLEKSQKIIKELSREDNDSENKADVLKQLSEEPSEDVPGSNTDYMKANTGNSFHFEFRTANNKDVKMSESALANSKKIFQDIGRDKQFDKNEEFVNTETEFKGFKTASNKQINISEEALVKSKNIFQDLNKFADDVQKSNADVQFKGFQTASNKEVKVSEEALARSRKIFQDISDERSTDTNTHKGNKNTENTSLFKGFQTASNKEISISAAALEKSRKLLEDISDVKLKLDNDEEKTLIHKNDSNFKGFQTASNKEVKISAAALAKSRKLFQDINNDILNNINDTDLNTMQSGENKLFKGFQTASNKEVRVSREALAKSRKIFRDINDEKTTILNTSEKPVDPVASSKFMGFQTASKKQVNISEEALAKSRNLFKDIDNMKSTDNFAQKDPALTKSSSFKGFQTASNKEVKISEEALSKSRKIFQDITEEKTLEISPQEQQIVKAPSAAFVGFKTASKKQVTVSEEALAKSKKIFDKINNDKTAENLPAPNNTDALKTTSFRGFQTASKKEVKVSEEALIKSRKMFLDIDNAEPHMNSAEIDRKSDHNMAFKGFQTASNKNVDVSKKAIAKSSELFQDIDLGLENNKMTLKEGALSEANLKLKRKDSFANSTIPKKMCASNNNKNVKAPKHKIELKVEQKCSENFEDIDTQMLNNFEVSMHEMTPKKSKRSGSPILSCPKSKKRKVFQIPYSQKSPKKSPEKEFKAPINQKPENTYNFNSSYKKTKCFNLKDLQRIEDNATCTEITDPYIEEFDFENILQFKFTDARNDINDSRLTIPDLKDLFLSSVNKKLVPDGWLDVQLQLIIWKLISYEIKFPKAMNLTCTAKNVIEQLKFRYDKELYNAERPALRKIFEKDDVSTKTLVLCVVAIYPAQDISQPPELLLTDGWYTIRAIIDKMLNKYVSNGKITVGTKLVTNGAELVGSEQAVSPWEDTSSFRLKLFGNSTRRARWHARLGYHGDAAILSRLSNVALDGGKVSKLRVFVTRVYPALYVDKFEDGSTVTRSERLEHIHQMKFDNERQALLEKIYEDVEKEVMDQPAGKASRLLSPSRLSYVPRASATLRASSGLR